VDFATSDRTGTRVADGLLALKTDPNDARADTELGAIQEHRRPGALVIEKSAVRRIEILQADVAIANFDKAMAAGDFRVIDGDIRPLASDHAAGTF